MQEGKQPGTCTEEMRTVKQKLEAIDTERYRGAIVRARAQRLLAGEMPTKRAFGLEKGTPARMTYQNRVERCNLRRQRKYRKGLL